MVTGRETAASFRYVFGPAAYDFSSRTHVMGILNVTPDSFSDGGMFRQVEQAVRRGLEMVEEGADLVDVGGESTRPGSEPVQLDEELRRVLPVIERLAREVPVPISIDTYKSAVADRALDSGALIVNDISGLHADPEMAGVIARHDASMVLMHIKGTPKTMQVEPRYENVVKEVTAYLLEGIERARRGGIRQIFVDPGIGFGKNLSHNLEILRNLKEFKQLGYPVLVGPSRKSFIGTLLELPVGERLEGTAAAVAVSIMNGANVVRVHDVLQMKRVARVVDAICDRES